MATLGQRLGLALVLGSMALPLSPAAEAAPANLTSHANVQVVQYYYGHGYYGRPHWYHHPHWRPWYRHGYWGGPRYGYYHRHRYWGRY
jgi:hypothetical protein